MLTHPYSFKGRLSRSQYVVNTIILCLICLLVNAMFEEYAIGSTIINPVTWALASLSLISLSVRRSKDLGLSPLWLLMPIYPLLLLVSPGEECENRFGPVPSSLTVASNGIGDVVDYDTIDCDGDGAD